MSLVVFGFQTDVYFVFLEKESPLWALFTTRGKKHTRHSLTHWFFNVNVTRGVQSNHTSRQDTSHRTDYFPRTAQPPAFYSLLYYINSALCTFVFYPPEPCLQICFHLAAELIWGSQRVKTELKWIHHPVWYFWTNDGPPSLLFFFSPFCSTLKPK